MGVDVPDERFVEAVRNHKPDILGISALLSITMPEMEVVIKELGKAGKRDKVRVIIGGAPITSKYARKIGADGYASDAVAGVNICKKWISLKAKNED